MRKKGPASHKEYDNNEKTLNVLFRQQLIFFCLSSCSISQLTLSSSRISELPCLIRWKRSCVTGTD